MFTGAAVYLWKCMQSDCLQPNGIQSNRLGTDTHTFLIILTFTLYRLMQWYDCLQCIRVCVCVCVLTKLFELKPKYVKTSEVHSLSSCSPLCSSHFKNAWVCSAMRYHMSFYSRFGQWKHKQFKTKNLHTYTDHHLWVEEKATFGMLPKPVPELWARLRKVCSGLKKRLYTVTETLALRSANILLESPQLLSGRCQLLLLFLFFFLLKTNSKLTVSAPPKAIFRTYTHKSTKQNPI